MLARYMEKCLANETLTEQEAYEAMHAMMSGEANEHQMAALLMLLRFRGETVDEMVGFVRAMREKMTRVHVPYQVVDTCGTGGDDSGTFNISTAVALLLASLGVKVAKHGNRAVSSASGSANVIEYFGIPMPNQPEKAGEALEKHGLVFLFAPFYHQAMKYVAPVRHSLRVRTVFNLLGPLVNPALPARQLIGVHSLAAAQKMAAVAEKLGVEHVVFVASRDGLDECSIAAETDMIECKNGRLSHFVLSPECVGLPRGQLQHVRVHSVEQSAQLIEQIFMGTAGESATNIVILNAAVALYVAERVKAIEDGVRMATEAIKNGDVYRYLKRLRGVSTHA